MVCATLAYSQRYFFSFPFYIFYIYIFFFFFNWQLGISYLLRPILCTYDISDNPKGFVRHFLDIPWVPMCYNLPANLSILQGIGDPSPCLYVFRWTLIRIPLNRPLSLGGGLFPNRGEPSIVLKTILVPRYVYGNTFPGGVPYTPNYQFWPLF